MRLIDCSKEIPEDIDIYSTFYIVVRDTNPTIVLSNFATLDTSCGDIMKVIKHDDMYYCILVSACPIAISTDYYGIELSLNTSFRHSKGDLAEIICSYRLSSEDLMSIETPVRNLLISTEWGGKFSNHFDVDHTEIDEAIEVAKHFASYSEDPRNMARAYYMFITHLKGSTIVPKDFNKILENVDYQKIDMDIYLTCQYLTNMQVSSPINRNDELVDKYVQMANEITYEPKIIALALSPYHATLKTARESIRKFVEEELDGKWKKLLGTVNKFLTNVGLLEDKKDIDELDDI
jgi:hypothetical protein